METSKLMTPLFCGNSFNREGRRMRAVFEREISNGTTTYRLWRSAGKTNLEYPRAENDRYILHVEINGRLAPLGMTDFYLVDHCGFKVAMKKLYGGDEEREQHFDDLRKSGDDKAVLAALDVERKEIDRYGSDPARQSDYIQKILNDHVSTYLAAKENGGKTFPDFIGALVMDDLARCMELSTVYKALKQEERLTHAARAEEEDKAFCEARNGEAKQVVEEAVNILRSGGVLENRTVKFYRSRYSCSAYSIVNYLMRLYHIDVPPRTQGWINDKLSSVTIKDGRCVSLRYLRAKSNRGSQTFSVRMNDLIRAVIRQASKGDEAA